jgi:glycosyltransferase involved in cell wall biosynthesis
LLPDLQARYETELILYEPTIAYPIPSDIPIHLLHSPDTSTHPVVYKAFRFGQRVIRLAERLRQGRYDIVLSFIDLNNVRTYFANILAGRQTRLILVEQTVSAQFFHLNPYTHRFEWLFKTLLRMAYRKADAVIAVSKAMRCYLQNNMMIQRPIDVIYNGIDLARFYPPSPDTVITNGLELKYLAAGVRLLCIARLEIVQKNQDFLIRLMPLIRRELPEAHLFLIGTGPHAEPLQQLVCDLGLQDCVHFLGWKDDVADYMRLADALLLASRYEPFGNVLVEALACGVPVVTTRSAEAADEILDGGRYGTIVPEHDPDAYARAVVETVRHRSTDSEYRAALARYARRFDQREMSRQYLAVLARVLGE